MCECSVSFQTKKMSCLLAQIGIAVQLSVRERQYVCVCVCACVCEQVWTYMGQRLVHWAVAVLDRSVAVCCGVLQCVAVWCSVLQLYSGMWPYWTGVLQRVAMW